MVFQLSGLVLYLHHSEQEQRLLRGQPVPGTAPSWVPNTSTKLYRINIKVLLV
eukprot:CAMPEP_0201282102 /NCGR_PEP_ID=MMETSP1317-20130820/4822_1 /ASSEMBLY_ACC=CAM_ASM_000770 /TAXON_ID=187299 /ORGANISM="Undescribed Undescribed, Strain Undescribed" /LENGTH=52 /DNA_ID=CAMNT_0047593871 /DNA_START=303 /DNA_END=461 /DNA_ORIENTATION=-